MLIIGPGSVTTNNTLGSSFDCDACGGHADDINARSLADLLNDPLVRNGFAEMGITIPPSTQFVAGVHETISDQIVSLRNKRALDSLTNPLAQSGGSHHFLYPKVD